MRENRPYGSEGGADELNRPSLPLSKGLQSCYIVLEGFVGILW
jgi:hypothetical protein